MEERPEALRLADLLEQIDGQHWQVQDSAAAELRRLQIDSDALGVHLSERMKDLFKVEAQRDALLEALKMIDKEFKKHGRQHWPEAVKAQAAIAKAEENT